MNFKPLDLRFDRGTRRQQHRHRHQRSQGVRYAGSQCQSRQERGAKAPGHRAIHQRDGHIERGDESEQRQALRLRARARGLELPEEGAVYLQRRFRRDLPTLYELLDAIDEAALQAQRRLTVPFIRQVLAQHCPGDPE